ncbi:MAG: hypothetical protein ACOYEQ_06255 [Bacillota bacterium]
MNTDPLVVLEAVGTIAVLSYVYKENAAYRFFEFTAIGLVAAHSIVQTWNNYLKPTVRDRLIGGGEWHLIFPAIIGLLYYTRVMGKDVSWLARYPISISVGYSIGYSLAYSPRPFLKEFRSTFASFKGVNDYIFLLIWMLVLFYFIFTLVNRENKVFAVTSVTTRCLIMLYMGMLFGTSILGKFSRLLGRYQFLLRDWLRLI